MIWRFVEKLAEVEQNKKIIQIVITKHVLITFIVFGITTVTIQDLIKDYNELRVGLQTLIHELDYHYGSDYEAEQDDNYASVMYNFRDRAIERFDQLEVRYTSMDVAYKDVVSYFGEDPGDMKPDEFFGIFQTFNSSWTKAKSDIETHKKKAQQAEKAKEFQEQRKARLKARLDMGDGKTITRLKKKKGYIN